MNAKLHQMLSDLRRALYEAIAESDDVHRTWRALREDGYSLSLTVDCKRDEDEERQEPIAATTGRPAFQINGDDLSFLRSIGIDPTRKVRRRR